jgi:hypothetical protein
MDRLMETIPFKKIRQEHPDKFLVLVDYQEKELSPTKFEVLGAQYYHLFDTPTDMYRAYRDLKKKGQNVIICTPDYQNSFVVERRFSMRVIG